MAKLTTLAVITQLKEKNLLIFTPREFCALFGISGSKGKYFLETNAKKGVFLRLKKGLYALGSDPPNEEVIANHLYRPSYISLEYALAHYRIIPEMVYSITSVTTKPTRSFTVHGKVFSYTTIRSGAFTGYMPIKIAGGIMLFAEPEKALTDYLYLVSLGKRSLNDRMRAKGINCKKFMQYAELFGSPRLLKLTKSLL